MYGLYSPTIDNCLLVEKEVSFSLSRENFGRVLWVNFLQFYICSNPVFKSPPISLCLSTTFQSKSPFFDPPTQTLYEEILCQN